MMLSIREKKYIKSLQIKKYRQQHQAFLVEGWKSVEELINSNLEIELLLIAEKFEKECNGRVIDRKEIKAISSLSNNNEAIAVAKMPSEDAKISPNEPVFVFDGIQDPGNLGTIIRTADWLGFKNVICSKDSVDFYNPKVITSTKGSFTRVMPVYLDLEEYFKEEKEGRIYLADLDGEDYKEVKFTSNDHIIFGSESQGIKSELRELMKHKISIPKKGQAESLNVAMSFGIIASSI